MSHKRSIDPEKAKEILSSPEHAAAVAMMKAAKTEEEKKWLEELAMLERRVKEGVVYVELDNGDKIALRSNLSEMESVKLGALNAERLAKETKKDRRARVTYEIIAMVTANRLITVNWLESNKDKFAVNDALRILLGYYDKQREEMEALVSFRQK